MFYRYEIKKHGGRDVLYLYMSMGEEESNEFVNRDNVSIEERIKRFIIKTILIIPMVQFI